MPQQPQQQKHLSTTPSTNYLPNQNGEHLIRIAIRYVMDSYSGGAAGHHVVMSYDEEDDPFVVDEAVSRQRRHQRPEAADYNDDAEDEDDDDEGVEGDDGDDEHDRHSDATDMIGGRKTTKYFFQK